MLAISNAAIPPKRRPRPACSTGRTLTRIGWRSPFSWAGPRRMAQSIASEASRPGITDRPMAVRGTYSGDQAQCEERAGDGPEVVHCPLEAVGAPMGLGLDPFARRCLAAHRLMIAWFRPRGEGLETERLATCTTSARHGKGRRTSSPTGTA
jgi:hypothetical protein